MDFTLYKPKDNAEGQLDADIGASTLSIALNTGQGANFPAIYRGTTTSLGSSTLLNKTGIGSSGIAVGDFIENITDGSKAYVLDVSTDSLTTSTLQGGSDNTWQNGDTYAVNRFIVTLNKRNDSGVVTASEKVLIDNRSSDILTVNASGRGFDGSAAQEFDADDYVNIFVTSRHVEELRKAVADAQRMLDLRYTKTEIDTMLSSRNWKDDVKVATTVAGTLATSFENGDTIDGIVLATNDRILIKDQADAKENGIYTVNASGAPTRATDFDATSEVSSAAVTVKQGTSNADTVWLCTSDDPVIGTDNINFSQFGAALIKASQAEAEAATNDTKYMTPLKTIQQIAEWGDIHMGTIGDNIVSGDLTGNENLVGLNTADGKWYKVTSTIGTQYRKLRLAMETGNADSSIKLMRRGVYPMSFSNINPTFSSSLTGTDNLVGNSNANRVRAFVIDNTNGAEAITTQITISAKQVGTPSGALLIYFALEQQEQANTPAVWWDETNDVLRGAIIATASIPQASFSGSYQNLAGALTSVFSGSVKIPAGHKLYYCVAKAGNADVSNHYVVQSNAQTLALDSSTQTWAGTANAGNYSLAITSTSPIGYAVKAFMSNNGSYGLTPSNPWARPVGIVLSASEFLFDPEASEKFTDHYSTQLTESSASNAIKAITTNFCPAEAKFTVTGVSNATTTRRGQAKGKIRGDTTSASSGQVYGHGSGTSSDDYLGNAIPGATGATRTYTNPGSSALTQNRLYCIRMEDGLYSYSGYPAGAGFLHGGNSASFSSFQTAVEVEASASP